MIKNSLFGQFERRGNYGNGMEVFREKMFEVECLRTDKTVAGFEDPGITSAQIISFAREATVPMTTLVP